MEILSQLRKIIEAHSTLCAEHVQKLDGGDYGPDLVPEEAEPTAAVQPKLTKQLSAQVKDRKKDVRIEAVSVPIAPKAQKKLASSGPAEAQEQKKYCLPSCTGEGKYEEEMVGCDNDSCRLEWFHFSCVGLKRKPKGSWYCDECQRIYGYH